MVIVQAIHRAAFATHDDVHHPVRRARPAHLSDQADNRRVDVAGTTSSMRVRHLRTETDPLNSHDAVVEVDDQDVRRSRPEPAGGRSGGEKGCAWVGKFSRRARALPQRHGAASCRIHPARASGRPHVDNPLRRRPIRGRLAAMFFRARCCGHLVVDPPLNAAVRRSWESVR